MAIQHEDLSLWAVVTADQRNSRRSLDQVPGALEAQDEPVADGSVQGLERTGHLIEGAPAVALVGGHHRPET